MPPLLEHEAAHEALQQLQNASGNNALFLASEEKRSIFLRVQKFQREENGLSEIEAVKKACFDLYQEEKVSTKRRREASLISSS